MFSKTIIKLLISTRYNKLWYFVGVLYQEYIFVCRQYLSGAPVTQQTLCQADGVV